MEKKETQEKKDERKNISTSTAVRALINGFVSYSVLIVFIFLTLLIVVSWIINNNKNVIDYDVLKYSLPAIAAFIIFFLVKGICNLSTYDLFKNCKIENDQIEKVSIKMNFFYICCVIFSVCVIIIYLLTRFNNEKTIIQNYSEIYYTNNEPAYAEFKINEMIDTFETEKTNVLIQAIIMECGLIFGIFSLIPTQKNLIKKYN
ncbi:MAG: hypothetical protein HFJ45_09425 [Clostridia bacterium]|nr:hypothetical protein [Clostridia bacterium]